MKLFRESKAAPIEVRRGALLTLNRIRSEGSIYSGSVPAAVKARRRKAAKVGRRADVARRRAAR